MPPGGRVLPGGGALSRWLLSGRPSLPTGATVRGGLLSGGGVVLRRGRLPLWRPRLVQ